DERGRELREDVDALDGGDRSAPVLELEGGLEVAGGLLEGEVVERLAAGPRRVADRRVEPEDGRRLFEVVGERRGGRRDGGRLQREADRRVEPGPLAGSELAFDGLADERVTEGERVTTTGNCPREPGIPGDVERVEDGGRVHAGGACKRLGVELRADDRRDTEYVVDELGEAPEPSCDHVPDALGKVERAQPVRIELLTLEP